MWNIQLYMEKDESPNFTMITDSVQLQDTFIKNPFLSQPLNNG